MSAPRSQSPVLESPSVLHLEHELDRAQPVRFYPDMLGKHRISAAVLGLVMVVAIVLVAVRVLPWAALLLLPLPGYAAYRFAQRGFDKKPLLTVYPEKGLVARECLNGIGWSLLDDVRLHERALGKAEIELQFRPGMPWPGVRGQAEPEDDPYQGRVLLLDISSMSPARQKQMYQTVIKHYMAYRIKRGWGISPSML
ncbi:MAG: hypothetical protein Q4G39_09225 [Brachymonas sp.]|nr:hypothetical protein [Brachymonas sp.]